MKRIFLGALLGLLAACGGGGGGNGTTTQPTQDQLDSIEILQTCTHPDLTGFLDLLDAFTQILDPSAANPPVLDFTAVTGTPPSVVSWTLDLDGDQTVDFVGSLRFTDGLGATLVPFDLTLLLPDGTRLADFFGSLADGTRTVLPFVSAGTGNVNGQWTAAMLSSLVDRLNGNVTRTGASCSSTFSFVDERLASLQGAVPNVTLDLASSDTPGLLTGTLRLDRSSTAFAAVHFQAKAEELTFFLDLVTGQAQIAP